MSGSLKVHGLLFKHKNFDTSYKLNSPSPTERGELMVLEQINGYITKIGTPINVKVGKQLFKNIYGANKVEGTPKADIALVTFNSKNKKFEDVCFISHKLGNNAKGFQQYSGITSKADGKKTGSISKDKNVIDFLKKISAYHDTIVNSKKRFYIVVKDSKLIGKAIYGPEFGDRKYGIDNIHLIGQGNAVMSKSGADHKLTFSTHVSFNPDVSEFMKDDYKTIIGARYSSGRNYEVNGKTYNGVRVLIMPKTLIGSKAEEL
jgi:hypothetical protein